MQEQYMGRYLLQQKIGAIAEEFFALPSVIQLAPSQQVSFLFDSLEIGDL